VKLRAIAQRLQCEIPDAAAETEILRIARPDDADDRSITFLVDPRFATAIAACSCPAVIVRKGASVAGKVLLEVDDPYVGYALTAQLFESVEPLFDGALAGRGAVDPTALVDPTASIGPGSVVGENCVVGARTRVGANCVIENGTRVGSDCLINSGAIICRHCTIGNRVIIESGAVVGSEGFGNARTATGSWVRIPSLGTVIVEDDVWIGANTCIDRGALGPTVLRVGSRFDNLVQIAHNVEVGENTAIAAQSGVSGSTFIGKRVIVAGQAGLAGHICIGDDSFIAGQTGISKSVPPGEKMKGTPARGLTRTLRISAAEDQLPELLKDFKRLKTEVEELRRQIAGTAGAHQH
jgi:UDP-3-O-[3-hydroxymyristoyl] glucosamine N-acyltransferase